MSKAFRTADYAALARAWGEAKKKNPVLTKAEFARAKGVSRGLLLRAISDPEDVVTTSPVLSPLERKERETKEERLKKEHALLVEQLREAQAREQIVLSLREQPPAVIKRRELGSGHREATAVAMLSDMHVEENVSLSQSGGVNEYNLGIAAESLQRFFSGVKWMNELYRPVFGIRDVVLAVMGDLMTGRIHDENVETGEMAPIETALWLRDQLSVGIRDLLTDEGIEQLTIVCVPGNHGRTTKKIHRATYSENSYEWLLYQQLAHEFRNEPRVRFFADKSPHKWVQVYDSTFHVCHGDDVSYNGGIGGLSIPLNKRIPIWDRLRAADVHLLGHFHQLRDFNNAVVNGSGIGYNAFALSIGAPPEPPQQGYFLWDSKRGKTCVSPIWVRK